jgi:hypothetical protein
MELRARIRPTLRHAGLMAAAAALLVPASAGTPTADAKTRAPVVKRVTPKRVFVGETMTVRGRYFRPGIGKNTVAFRRKGAKIVLVRADKSTRKLLRVKLPKRLEKVLPVQNGTPVATRLQVRVMSTRFGRRYTSRAMSPIVGPEKPPAPPLPPTADPNGDCDLDGALNRVDADDDNDLLTDADEADLNKLLDACKADTDGDGAEDGYEYQSARDLNDDEHQSPNAYTPYPRKLPYPNPLDGKDGTTDHDGDDLTLVEEFKLWSFTTAAGAPRTLAGLTYSAGQQYSVSLPGGGSRTPTLEYTNYDRHNAFLAWAQSANYESVRLSNLSDEEWWSGGGLVNIRDFDRDGTVESAGRWDEATYYNHLGGTKLDDSERDEDADGLTNWAETRGCMQQSYWSALYKKETPYPLTYAGTRHDDPDTDGDTIRDGADDEDHDDIPNVMECSRALAAEGAGPITIDALDASTPNNADGRRPEGWVNPFNPCLPYTRSRGCKQIVTIGGGWAPFNTKPADIFFIHN